MPASVKHLQEEKTIDAVRRWIESFVVALNLCPFAKRELLRDRVRFVVTGANTEAQLLAALQDELKLLEHDAAVETTLLIFTDVLQNFDDYNQFLEVADSLLIQMGLEGVYQIASFHPQYQFEGSDADDVENFTNRSPYPMLHLLREQSLDRVLADFTNPEQIPLRNIELMKSLEKDWLLALSGVCRDDGGST